MNISLLKIAINLCRCKQLEDYAPLIDYVIQRQHSKLKTTDLRVYHKAEYESDHHVVMTKIIVHHRKTNIIFDKNQQQHSETKEHNYKPESIKQESI